MRRYYRICKTLCELFICGSYRVRAYGSECVPTEGGALLLSNHQSFFDPIAVGLAINRECHYMARDSLFEIPLLGRLFASLNAFPVRRDTADISAMKEAIRRLRAGAILCVFPEATRTPDGGIHPIKGGAIALAQRAKVPIVPTVIEGLFEIWPRTKKFPGFGRRIGVLYGLPVDSESIRDRDPDDVAGELTLTLRRLHNQLRANMGRPPLHYPSE